MKVLCSSCEAAEALVLCCADEAALCATCDRHIHAANRLAGQHQRLPLLAPAAPVLPPPKCDICQERHAYFFCLEDRALLCRGCDVAVHTANAFVSAHRRFLLTGVQVSSADPPEPLYGGAERDDHHHYATAAVDRTLAEPSLMINEQFSSAGPRRNTPAKRSPRLTTVLSGHGGMMMDSPLGEFFGGGGFSNFNTGGEFDFGENGTSKADSGKLGGSPQHHMTSPAEDWSSDRDLFGEVPEMQRSSVPELPSLPTASGLHWQRRRSAARVDGSASVPDISSPEYSLSRYCFSGAGQTVTAAKRRRNG